MKLFILNLCLSTITLADVNLPTPKLGYQLLNYACISLSRLKVGNDFSCKTALEIDLF